MKRISIFIFITAFLLGAGLFLRNKQDISKPNQNSGSIITSTVKFVNSTITADGAVTAQNQARLAFQTSGKLAYIGIKEGDRVKAGHILASLDLGDLQTARTKANYAYLAADANAKQIEDQVKGHDSDETFAQKTQRVTAQTARDTAYDAMLAAQRAIDNAQLKAPFDGIVTQVDSQVAGVSITPTAGIVIVDPESLVFRANVPASYIYYISQGSQVNLAVDGIQEMFSGKVVKIFPSKVVLPGGQAVYQVDIESPDLKITGKLDQTGKAIINTNSENVALVPAWTVLGGNYIWVNNNGTPELKQVNPGKIHGNEIEIVSGMSTGDKIITDPKYIPSLKYLIL
jgi:membrane fusion protein (multidrug efflux system)